MSHSSINDKLRQLASNIQAGVDNSELVNAIAMPKEQHSISNIKNIDLRSSHDFRGSLVPGLDKDDQSGKGECVGGFLPRCIFVKPKSTWSYGFLVLQRIEKQDGTTFIATSLFGTKHDAYMFASNFDNVVAIMPIEWEE